MKRIGMRLMAGMMGALLSATGAQAGDEAFQRFQKGISEILNDPCLANENYGIKIVSLDRNETMYSARAEQLFSPASNMKLVTTAAALRHLGPDYRFNTHLYATGKIEGETLYGDLYLKGLGDPKLVSEQMWLIANDLKNFPLKRITGNLVADDSYFDGTKRVPTWKKNVGAQPYNAPMGALSFNFNTVKVFVTPAEKIGQAPVVVVDPENDYIRVANRARTVPPGKRSRLIVNRVEREGYDLVTVSGLVSQDRARKEFYLNITDPSLYTIHVFRKYLEHAGVKVEGETRLGLVPPAADLLVEHKSEPLAVILRGLNKYSNNFVAEQILKTLGVERFGPPGTTEKGLRVMEDFMKLLGYAPEQFRILDGSGLSRQNQLSPDQIVQVLKNMRGDFAVFPEFISALGVMGVDGSVKDRLNHMDLSQRVRVKTGTLNFISSLSGYFQSSDGELFAFSILMNDLKCTNGKVLKIQDAIVQEGLLFRRAGIPADKDKSPALAQNP
ncbi:MAG: D-alanyl-D-alanine carboxypeptidase/D-alanyl-D-alanine-endopeptidase [Nitrospinae bacterium CG11_big_fil_rev_8_21_14_0_20_56_8]|nr:MAG: D-alanyl-D-alanine carboxypeptidase/D-alanyl-D-alanine-endopeptidase [Nitrospinae bacterium CG11_big_fil_rev_8_21_14_0_20_56_8]